MKTRELRPGWFFRRGDIYLANLNPFTGSEPGGTRPVLVLQNNDGNFYCPTLIVAPMTTQIKTIDKSQIKGYLGKLTKEQLGEIDDYLKISLGMYIPETVEAP